MQFCLQLAPHANIRYRDAQVKLGQAELTCLLCALSLPAETQVTAIGGVPCLTFSAKALTPEALALLGTHSTRLMLFECVDGGLLRPLDWERTAYLPDDLSEILKYKGKTSAAFTHMMMNCARAASDFALADQPLTVLDPMCGKCTTGFVALQNGMNAICLDIDRKDLKEAADYFSNYLQFHRLKHRLAQSSRTLQKTAVPIAEYTFSDTKEHFAADDVRTLMLAEGGQRACRRPAEEASGGSARLRPSLWRAARAAEREKGRELPQTAGAYPPRVAAGAQTRRRGGDFLQHADAAQGYAADAAAKRRLHAADRAAV